MTLLPGAPVSVRDNVVRWLVLVLVSLLVGLVVSERSGVPDDTLTVGDIASRTVKAPYGFTWQDETAFADARRRAREQAPRVFLHDEGLPDAVRGVVHGAFRVARERMAAVPPDPDAAVAALREGLGVDLPLRHFATLVDAGLPEEAESTILAWWAEGRSDRLVLAHREDLPSDGRPIAVAGSGGGPDRMLPPADARIASPSDVREAIGLAAVRSRRTEAWALPAEAIATALVRPDLVYDPSRTEAAVLMAVADVKGDPVLVQRGEILFREGDRLSERAVAMYRALQTDGGPTGALSAVLAAAATMMLVLGVAFGGTRQRFEHEQGTRDLAALGGMIVVMAVLARIIVSSGPGIAELVGYDASAESVWFLLPAAGGAMLLRVLMGPYRVAIYVVAVGTVAALSMRFEALHVLYVVLTCLVGSSMVVWVGERISILMAGVKVGLFGALAAVVFHLVEQAIGGAELSLAMSVRPMWSVLFALLGGVLSGFFVLAIVPLFEAAGFVTDLRMLELASLNHPVMKQLMLRAPGTYHHSVVVGTLAEAACDAIGANALQAKISAYFHDIGKALEPRYFAENQRGGNPHNELEPHASAAILIRHVTEGARMAREHRLPKPIIDNILMHHGTGLIQYFYAAAQAAADRPQDVDEASFRYPGPKPNTRESGVVMLADKVEAATRTIQNPNEGSIRAMIGRIVGSVIADQQFTECPLTFQEIHTIAETFVTVLLGIHHQRVEYPQTRSISRGEPDEDAASGQLPMFAHAMNTITGERPTPAPRRLARDDGDDTTDEATDYESVLNLPRGED